MKGNKVETFVNERFLSLDVFVLVFKQNALPGAFGFDSILAMPSLSLLYNLCVCVSRVSVVSLVAVWSGCKSCWCLIHCLYTYVFRGPVVIQCILH